MAAALSLSRGSQGHQGFYNSAAATNDAFQAILQAGGRTKKRFWSSNTPFIQELELLSDDLMSKEEFGYKISMLLNGATCGSLPQPALSASARAVSQRPGFVA